jgi:anti-anti-sigma factor
MEQAQSVPVYPHLIVVLANHPTDDTVICLPGEHDKNSVVDLAQAVDSVVDEGRSDLVFDLSGVEFMDSTTTTQLLIARTHPKVDGRMARLPDPSAAARRVMELCGLTHLVAP